MPRIELAPEVDTWVDEVFGVAALGKRAPVDPDPEAPKAAVSLVRLGKARIEWIAVRHAAASDIALLKDAIRQKYAAFPGVSNRVESALGKLDTVIETLNENLQDQLDELLNADGTEARKRIAAKVRVTASKFDSYAASDSVAASIDGTAYLPSTRVIGPVRAKLADILSALGAID